MSISRLMTAAKEGKLDEVEDCLRGIDVNTMDEEDRTALHWAVCMGQPTVVGFLLQKGADVDTVDEGGMTPLLSACSAGIESVVDMILKEQKVDVNQHFDESNSKTPLFVAVSKNRVNIAHKLLKAGADCTVADGSLQTPLHRAVIKSAAEVIETLLANGADVNAQDRVGDTPLHYASIEGNKYGGFFFFFGRTDQALR